MSLMSLPLQGLLVVGWFIFIIFDLLFVGLLMTTTATVVGVVVVAVVVVIVIVVIVIVVISFR